MFVRLGLILWGSTSVQLRRTMVGDIANQSVPCGTSHLKKNNKTKKLI